MFTIRTETCDLTRAWSRRDAMRIAAGWTCLGSLAPMGRVASAAETAAQPTWFGRAKSCIFIYLYGGPSHIDIWDLKPDAPAEIRGEFKPIATKIPGYQITEHLPKLAERADRLAIIRSLTHDSPAHGSAGHRMLTGHVTPTNGEIAPTASDAPHFGSVVAKQLGAAGLAPAFVSAPWKITTQVNVIPGQDAAQLGRAFDPVRVQYDDVEGKQFLLPDARALQTALSLDRESEQTRDRYGRNVFGQSLLLARRLVEAGVRVVTVYWPDRRDEKALFYGGKRQPVSVPMWDTHGKVVGDTANFPSLKNRLLPPLDMASSALVDDLTATGRLDETLVVWTGEFGRSPRILGDGRGHYSRCFSSMLAGGGVQGGAIYGQSDMTASSPAKDLVTPGDFFATMYHLLGVPLDTKLPGPNDQPRPLATGKVIQGLLV